MTKAKRPSDITDDIIVKVAEYLKELGISLEMDYQVYVNPSDIPLIIEDRNLFINSYQYAIDKTRADKYDVTVEQYRRYTERHGVPQCDSTTQSGKRCQYHSKGHRYSRLSIHDFIKIDGLPCHVHE